MNTSDRLEAGHQELSKSGDERRRQILHLAESALAMRTRRRRRLRGASGAAAVLLLSAVAYWVLPVRPVVDGTLPIAIDRPDDLPKATSSTGPQIVQNDPTIVQRLSAPPRPSRTMRINDDDLLELLHAAGRPEGLIQIEGQVFLSSELRRIAQLGEELDPW